MANLMQRNLKISNLSNQWIRHYKRKAYAPFDPEWRQERKLPANPNSFGPLTNLPDYSFKDGKPVPYGTNQKIRIDNQHEHLKRIKKLVGEIDYAVLRHERLQKAIEENKQKILDSKLKEKGNKLLISDDVQNL